MNTAVKLDREKRKTAREERLFAFLSQEDILLPLVGVAGALGIQKLGHSRIIDRDYAGFLLSLWTVLVAARAGVTDKWALAALTAAAVAAYSLATPATDEEAVLTISPSKLLGGDGKLFWWDLTTIPGITAAS